MILETKFRVNEYGWQAAQNAGKEPWRDYTSWISPHRATALAAFASVCRAMLEFAEQLDNLWRRR
jgi:hypothetical protein